MRVAIASDHTAMELRENIAEFVRGMGHEVVDLGTNDPSRADYPVYGRAVGDAVASGKVDRGIAICGTGIGISIAANKVPGVRCVVCSEPYSAALSRQHNDSNVLAFGARVVGDEMAKMITREWLVTEFEGGRHQRRVNQLNALDEGVEIADQVDPLA
ncbi:ribose 5-phosphate isomerase B [Tessaracoccus palaemonis]|uniref:Ribose 5-phosphate isomerase B n=1 Tax=Tessaracoccus palaemonis TaxID=2829499 RepID=A0ABX8SL49_9ACTN|nr:ribose 5-phosphate isomerase B [Tessaracoccus palaemonis]QXT64111.1 ribose 5-phosphate isomerase B [Tessaracoccus palaemonis]